MVFPHMVVPLFVGREKSLGALGEVTSRGDDREIFLSAQRVQTDEPTPEDIFQVGTVANVIQVLRLPDGTVKVLVEGKRRAVVRRFVESENFLAVEVDDIPEDTQWSAETEAAAREAHAAFASFVKLDKRLASEILASVHSIENPGDLADTIAAQLQIKLSEKQAILEMVRPVDRLVRLAELLRAEIEVLQSERKMRSRVRRQVEKRQEEQILNDQLNSAQREAGERDEFKTEFAELEERVSQVLLSKEAAARIQKEMKKLRLMAPMSAEAAVVRNYIDWVLALPWGTRTEDKLDVVEAERILDLDHFGLKKVKERIL
ncbi:MAG TPA: LON peptidase substrate-binding domain-containing protein, partial [Polyangia bacterium]